MKDKYVDFFRACCCWNVERCGVKNENATLSVLKNHAVVIALLYAAVAARVESVETKRSMRTHPRMNDLVVKDPSKVYEKGIIRRTFGRGKEKGTAGRICSRLRICEIEPLDNQLHDFKKSDCLGRPFLNLKNRRETSVNSKRDLGRSSSNHLHRRHCLVWNSRPEASRHEEKDNGRNLADSCSE